MIRTGLAVISALVYLAGALALVVGCIIAWLWIIAVASQQTHWIVAVILFVGSLWAGQRYEAWLQVPWELWRLIWSHFDVELERRIR